MVSSGLLRPLIFEAAHFGEEYLAATETNDEKNPKYLTGNSGSSKFSTSKKNPSWWHLLGGGEKLRLRSGGAKTAIRLLSTTRSINKIKKILILACSWWYDTNKDDSISIVVANSTRYDEEIYLE